MSKQSNTRAFQTGDRIIYQGEYIGTLQKPDDNATERRWSVKWEDGAQNTGLHYERDMVHANGGPTSAQRPNKDILDLAVEYEAQLDTDPMFHARVTGVANVLVELQRMGRLDPAHDGGFAAFIVMAALEKELPRDVQSEAWQRGVADVHQAGIIRQHPTDPYKEAKSE